MVDTTFVPGTVIASAWLNDVNDTVYGLPSTVDAARGAGNVGFNYSLNYAVGTIGWLDKQNELNVMWFTDVYNAVVAGTDCTAAVAAVIALRSTNGGAIYFPFHTNGYLFTGAAGADGTLNGILLPFTTVNPDFSKTLRLRGDNGTTFKCNSNNMILVRTSRNNVVLEDIHLSANSKTGCWAWGIVPESVTQTTTLVSQQFITGNRVTWEGFTEGLVIQPGPRVGGSDSGCFYMKFDSCKGNLTTRHVYSKKGATWAVDNNRLTRVKFTDCNFLRGNCGYYLEVGSEIIIEGGFEEFINTGGTPLATPTARYVTADCSQIVFIGGYSESCTLAVDLFDDNVDSWGYVPASGATTKWRTYASAWADKIDDNRVWTPVVNSSGGGAQGASTSIGMLVKQGKLVHFTCQVSAEVGTLAAGSISISGLPFVADSTWTGPSFQSIPVCAWNGITLGAGNVGLQAYISGATLNIRKLSGTGGAPTNLMVADCATPIRLTIQGTYKAV